MVTSEWFLNVYKKDEVMIILILYLTLYSNKKSQDMYLYIL